MLTSISKTMLSFPLIVLICSVFHVLNGGTINTNLTFIFMSAFFAIVCTLVGLIFSLIRRIFTILEAVTEDENDQIIATLDNEEDLKEFLINLEKDILKNIADKKEKK